MVSAVAIAASSMPASYAINVSNAIKWLFNIGLCGQDSYPVLKPKVVHDTVEGGEGPPLPMLAVSCLALKVLKTHLPANSKLFVSLNNNAKNFVVTGPSRSLYGLVLRKIRGPAGLDQSKIIFSALLSCERSLSQ